MLFTALLLLTKSATNYRKHLPLQSLLHNSITVAVLEVNFLPVCKDEVHLIVHTNVLYL